MAHSIDNEIQDTLYRLFIAERRYKVEEMARKVNRGSWVIRDYISGRRTCPAGFLAECYDVTRDRDFLAPMLDSVGVAWFDIPSATPDDTSEHAIWTAGTVALREHTDVHECLRRALEDGRISRQEALEIRREARQEVGAMAYLEELCQMAWRASARPVVVPKATP